MDEMQISNRRANKGTDLKLDCPKTVKVKELLKDVDVTCKTQDFHSFHTLDP